MSQGRLSIPPGQEGKGREEEVLLAPPPGQEGKGREEEVLLAQGKNISIRPPLEYTPLGTKGLLTLLAPRLPMVLIMTSFSPSPSGGCDVSMDRARIFDM